LGREFRLADEEAYSLEGIGDCDLRSGDTQNGIAYPRQTLGLFEA
jgi:hypothetical protein